MLERTAAAGVGLAWVTGDCISGDDRKLRRWLDQHSQADVLAVSGKEAVWLQQRQQKIKAILAAVPHEGWHRISAGAGSKGPRWSDGVRLALHAPRQAGWNRWLVVRRTCSEPHEVTASVAFAPAHTTLTEQVQVAGERWTVEESIQTATGEVGLDHSRCGVGAGGIGTSPWRCGHKRAWQGCARKPGRTWPHNRGGGRRR
jgi:SRSO17 transposase